MQALKNLFWRIIRHPSELTSEISIAILFDTQSAANNFINNLLKQFLKKSTKRRLKQVTPNREVNLLDS